MLRISAERLLAKSASSRVITADTTHVLIEPSHIIEYEWPPKSGERYFIQVLPILECFVRLSLSACDGKIEFYNNIGF